jgi:hypothetical protein
MKRKNRTMVRGVAGRVKAFLPFCLFTFLPLNIHAQQISAKNEVIDCGSVVYEQPVTAKFELQNMSSNPLVIKIQPRTRMQIVEKTIDLSLFIVPT